MGFFSAFRRVSHTEIRDGLISFQNDDFRIERGPQMVRIHLNEGDDLGALFALHGIDKKYLAERVDSTGTPVAHGVDLRYWAHRGPHVWHFYAYENGQFRFKTMIDAPKEDAIAKAKRLIKESL